MKIYLDACCYCRPFDNLIDEKMKLEAEAILMIKKLNLAGNFKLYTGRIVEFELGKIKNIKKKMMVLSFYKSANASLLDFCSEIERISDEFENYNVKYMDALHIAYCEFYQLDYMLTTDHILIKSAKRINTQTKVINPLNFITEVF